MKCMLPGQIFAVGLRKVTHLARLKLHSRRNPSCLVAEKRLILRSSSHSVLESLATTIRSKCDVETELSKAVV